MPPPSHIGPIAWILMMNAPGKSIFYDVSRGIWLLRRHIQPDPWGIR